MAQAEIVFHPEASAEYGEAYFRSDLSTTGFFLEKVDTFLEAFQHPRTCGVSHSEIRFRAKAIRFPLAKQSSLERMTVCRFERKINGAFTGKARTPRTRDRPGTPADRDRNRKAPW